MDMEWAGRIGPGLHAAFSKASRASFLPVHRYAQGIYNLDHEEGDATLRWTSVSDER
ncbi:hypothetical protein ASZ90_011171 [hydrocarbon metagenome]|uniref:Uncharacterized protein n=1 Tax=hydrocarbon metagenome TaxID=938273 RepID=A0A0W8FFQ4_9ZZZZ